MADNVSPAVRSRIMSSIKGRDTKPELALRRTLHAMGLRFKCHGDLPGRPDIVFPGRRAVVFVHGCFWHDHGCGTCRAPATNRDFWRLKFERNVSNDRRAVRLLIGSGWRVMIVWECAINQDLQLAANEAFRFVTGSAGFREMARWPS